MALIASVVVYTPTTAQLTGGLKGGMSATNFIGAVPEGTNWVTGFTVGGFVTSHLVADLSFQAELLYSPKEPEWHDLVRRVHRRPRCG